MLLERYLVVGRRRRSGSYTHALNARLTKTRPRLESHELAIKLRVEIPDALFEKPTLTASFTVPKEAAVGPVIDTVVTDNVQEAIEQATGLKFEVSVVEPESTS